MDEPELKQVIIIRKDLDMGTGKLVAQGAHASLMSYLETVKSHKDVAERWISEGEKKIVLKIDDEEKMKRLAEAFKYKAIPCALVSDAGLTQLPRGTMTALGIGPWKAKDLDILTGALKLL
jgi:PTH2 family peptidyl-tRNA hydrolase